AALKKLRSTEEPRKDKFQTVKLPVGCAVCFKFSASFGDTADFESSFFLLLYVTLHPHLYPAESLSRGDPKPEKLLFFLVSNTSFSKDTRSSRRRSLAESSVADFSSLAVGGDCKLAVPNSYREDKAHH
ncbi:mCG144831, partial [Mus musculus]